MKRALLTLLAIVAALVLSACAPEQGDVIEKKYVPDREWYSTEPVYVTESYPCTKTRTSTVNGKTTTQTYTTTCTRQAQRGTEQRYHYSPEEYRLKIDDGGDTGWVSVSETTYEDASIGDWYDHGEVSER